MTDRHLGQKTVDNVRPLGMRPVKNQGVPVERVPVADPEDVHKAWGRTISGSVWWILRHPNRDDLEIPQSQASCGNDDMLMVVEEVFTGGLLRSALQFGRCPVCLRQPLVMDGPLLNRPTEREVSEVDAVGLPVVWSRVE